MTVCCSMSFPFALFVLGFRRILTRQSSQTLTIHPMNSSNSMPCAGALKPRSTTSSTRLASLLFTPKKWSTSSKRFSQGLPCTTSPSASPLAWSFAAAAKSTPTKPTFPPPYIFAAIFFGGMCIHLMLKPCLHVLFPLSDPAEKGRVSSPRKAFSASSTE